MLTTRRRIAILEKLAAAAVSAEATFRKLLSAKALAANPGTAGEGAAATASVERLRAKLKDLGHTEETAQAAFGANVGAAGTTRRAAQQNAERQAETFKEWKSKSEAEHARAAGRAAEQARKDALRAGGLAAIPHVMFGGSIVFEGVRALRRQQAAKRRLIRGLAGSAVALGGLGVGGAYYRKQKAKSF